MAVNVSTEELFALIGRMKVEIDKKNDMIAQYETAVVSLNEQLTEARERECQCERPESEES